MPFPNLKRLNIHLFRLPCVSFLIYFMVNIWSRRLLPFTKSLGASFIPSSIFIRIFSSKINSYTYFGHNTQKSNPPIVFAIFAISFLENWHNNSNFPILRYIFFFPSSVADAVSILTACVTWYPADFPLYPFKCFVYVFYDIFIFHICCFLLQSLDYD